MTLGCQVIDLIRLDLLDYPDQVSGICQVAVMQDEVPVFSMRVLVQMVYTVCIETGGPALDTVDYVVLVQEQFCQVCAVLSGDAGD